MVYPVMIDRLISLAVPNRECGSPQRRRGTEGSTEKSLCERWWYTGPFRNARKGPATLTLWTEGRVPATRPFFFLGALAGRDVKDREDSTFRKTVAISTSESVGRRVEADIF
jgi:hypothetical protein